MNHSFKLNKIDCGLVDFQPLTPEVALYFLPRGLLAFVPVLEAPMMDAGVTRTDRLFTAVQPYRCVFLIVILDDFKKIL